MSVKKEKKEKKGVPAIPGAVYRRQTESGKLMFALMGPVEASLGGDHIRGVLQPFGLRATVITEGDAELENWTLHSTPSPYDETAKKSPKEIAEGLLAKLRRKK